MLAAANEPRQRNSATISHELIGSSRRFQDVLDNLKTVGAVGCTVLLRGETGSGKEVAARAIHDASSRRNRPFIALNCAAIPAELMESELFGHERGAFTGAIARTVGKLQAADGGTLFLDEIGDLPFHLQPKLLRVLQEQQFERLGSGQTQQVDLRIVAATNRDLLQMVRENRFRDDLYYRLNVFPIELPALRDRREDIPMLAVHFVRKFADRHHKNISHIPEELLESLTRYDWPGNIRELQNFMERSVILSRGETLHSIAAELTASEPAKPATGTLSHLERSHILTALQESRWRVGGPQGAAARLGLPRTTLQAKMEKLGIVRGAGEAVAFTRRTAIGPIGGSEPAQAEAKFAAVGVCA